MHRGSRFPRVLALALAIGLAAAPIAVPRNAAAQAVTIVVGGNPLALEPGPIERNGRVFVPLRGIFERLGATVVYADGNINATKGHTTVALSIGSTRALVNGQVQYFDVAPFIVGATTYVPLRFIAQSLGANVNYNDNTRVVAIGMAHPQPYYPPPNPPRPNPPPPNPPPPAGPVYLNAQHPSPGSGTGNRFVQISAQFSRPVQPGGVRVWLDGNGITDRAGVYNRGFSYNPPAPLAYGSHTVRTTGYGADGVYFDRSWSFTVTGAPPPPANPIELQNVNPGRGATVQNRFATISGDFSRPVDTGSIRIRLDGNNITGQSGIGKNSFSFKPPAPLSFGSHTVRVDGKGAGGMDFDRQWSFTVAGQPVPHMHLTISNPPGDAVVGNTFTVRGNTVGNAKVVVTAGAGDSATGQFRGNTTAGPYGNFSIAVSITRLMGQGAVRVRIVATDPVTQATREQVLQLRLK